MTPHSLETSGLHPVYWEDLRQFCGDRQKACQALEAERRKAAVPSTRLTVLGVMGSVAMIAISAAVWWNSMAIRTYDNEVAQNKYELSKTHDLDMASIKAEMKDLMAVQAGINDKLDRSFAVIEKIAKKAGVN